MTKRYTEEQIIKAIKQHEHSVFSDWHVGEKNGSS